MLVIVLLVIVAKTDIVIILIKRHFHDMYIASDMNFSITHALSI